MTEKVEKDTTCGDCKLFVYDAVPATSPGIVPATGECRFESPKIMAGMKESQFPNIEAIKWCSHHETKPPAKVDKAEKPHTQVCPSCLETVTQTLPTTWVHPNTPLSFECKCGNKFSVPVGTADTVAPKAEPEHPKAHAETEHASAKAHAHK